MWILILVLQLLKSIEYFQGSDTSVDISDRY